MDDDTAPHPQSRFPMKPTVPELLRERARDSHAFAASTLQRAERMDALGNAPGSETLQAIARESERDADRILEMATRIEETGEMDAVLEEFDRLLAESTERIDSLTRILDALTPK